MHQLRNASGKKIVFTVILFALMSISVIQLFSQIIYANQSLFADSSQISVFKITALAVFAMAVFCGLISITVFTSIRKEKLYLISLLTIGLFYIFIFAPATTPDETVHFKSAYYLSNFLCCPVQQLRSEPVLMRSEDFHFFNQVISIAQSKDNYLSVLQNFSLLDHSTEYIAARREIAVANAPLGYVVSGIVIALGRMLHLGFYPIFYLGRLSNLLVYASLTYIAMQRTPVGKNVIFVLSLLPMTLHITASFSYDCYAIAFTMIFLVEILRTIYLPGSFCTKQMVILSLLGFAVAATKVVYIPVLLAFFLIPNSKISENNKKAIGTKVTMLMVCCVLFILSFLPQLTSNLTSEDLDYTDQQSYTISWVLHNILPTIRIFLRTLKYNYELYIEEMVGVSLGWFQIFFDTGIVYIFVFIILLSFGIEQSEPYQHGFTIRLTLFSAVAASILLVLASMFFAWTPLNDVQIAGVQGRYFLPLLFPLSIAAQNSILKIEEKYMRYIFAIILTLNFSCIMSIVSQSYSYIP